MKIEKENFKYKDYKEILNIIINKKFIITNKKIRIDINWISIIIVITLLLLPLILPMNEESLDSYSNIISIIIGIIAFINIFIIGIIKAYSKNSKYTEFQENKINEVLNNDSSICVHYEKINCIIYGKRVICLLFGNKSNTSVFCYLISNKEKVIEKLKKHNKDIKILSYYK